jgi:hypothetical protein
MDIADIGLRLVGAFYVFAGYIATRAALTSHILDKALAAIGGKGLARVEIATTVWHLVAAALVLASGLALLLRLELALGLFVASALGQAAYIFVVAPLWFDREDPPDPAGRRQTINAFVIYSAVTALVAWASLRGLLLDWRDLPGLLLALPGAVFAVHILYVLKTLYWPADGERGQSRFASPFGGPDEPQRPPHQSKRVKLMAEYGSHPLWALDHDTDGDVSPAELGLSEELTRDLIAWGERHGGGLNRIDEPSRPWTEADFAAHEAEARPLAIRLVRERPDLTVFVLEPEIGIVEVRPEDRDS